MPTIIDAFVVSLGLDSRDLDKKTPTSTKKLKDLEAQAGKTEKSAKKLGSTTKEASSAFSEVTRAAAGFLALIGGTMAIKGMVADFIETNAQLNRLSQNLGISVSDISAWGQAVEQSGGTAAGLQGTLDMLAKSQTQLKLTGESSLIPYLSMLGVSLVDVNNKALSATDELAAIGDGLERARARGMSRTDANNILRQMGIDQGTANLLLQNRAERERLLKVIKQTTAATDAQGIAAQKFKTKLVQLQQKFEAFGRTLFMSAAPAMEKVLDWLLKMGDWVMANSQAVGDFLKVLAVGLGAIALAAVPIDLVVVAIGAVAAAIALLWQDYQVWKRGGDSLIDWNKWEPGITAAGNGLKWLGGIAKETFHALGNIASIGKNLINGNRAAAGASLVKLFGGDPSSPQVQAALAAHNGAPQTLTADYMMSYFQKRGVSKDHAAGIVASLMGESSGKTNAVGDHGHAYGLAQWQGPRQADFKKWAGHDMRLSTADEQLDFVLHELQTTHKAAGIALNSAKGAYASGDIVSRLYESPADVEGNAKARGNYAASLYGIPGASASVGSPSTSAASTDASKTVNIGTIEVHTQATDGPGIAAGIGDSLRDFLFTSQANSGFAY